jgi:hypothetical protein
MSIHCLVELYTSTLRAGQSSRPESLDALMHETHALEMLTKETLLGEA